VAAGYPRGRLAAAAGSATVLVVASLAGSALGFLAKAACRAGAWNVGVAQYQAHCYTDIYPLYFQEQLWRGQVPYLGHPVEYPVLIGGAMQAVAWIVQSITDPYIRGREFFDGTVVLLTLCAVAGVLATAYLAGPRRRWTALLVALSPALILASFINWDLVAMALTALAMAAWAARRGMLAGVLFGLAVATKFYPLVLIGALSLLCLRAGRLRQFGTMATAAAAAWLVVNVPFAIAAPAGWSEFYRLNSTRGPDWGSIWYFFSVERWPVLDHLSLGPLNLISLLLFLAAAGGLAVLVLAAPRRPRVPQVFFLILAAFLLVNKVWSPQYVIWLVPLAVLARPRVWPYVLWQLAEVAYFLGIWGYFYYLYQPPGAGYDGISTGWYFVILAARLLSLALLASTVVADILQPQRDRVRASGLIDDPAGGVLDQAPDRLAVTWHRVIRHPAEAAAS